MRRRDRILLVGVFVLFISFPSALGQAGKLSERIPAPNLLPATASSWVNVKDYGARGNGITDDTPAMLAAITEAIARPGGNVVYFPATNPSYLIASPLRLPPTNNRWVTLFFDGKVTLDATIEMNSLYAIHGNSSGSGASFSKGPMASFEVRSASVNPAIHISGKTSVRIENIKIAYMRGNSDGILIDGDSATITLNNVHVFMDANNLTGVPFKALGGFGYYFEDGGYQSSAFGSAPSMLFAADPTSHAGPNQIKMKKVFLAEHGVKLDYTGAFYQNGLFSMEDTLYENFRDSLVTIVAPGNLFVGGIHLLNNCMADAPLLPFPPIITAFGTNINSVTVIYTVMSGDQAVVGGDVIHGLEIWTYSRKQPVGQDMDYVIHRPSGIEIRMPISFPPGQKNM
jgi:hypothetical protein